MEPLKPKIKQRLLSSPQTSPQDVEEYESLLSLRFTIDPSLPESADIVAASEERLKTLYQKLYPSADSETLESRNQRSASSVKRLAAG